MKPIIQAIKDKIIVKVLREEKMSDGGIVIPESAIKDPQLTCEVISVGDEVKELNPGNTIYCHRNAGMDMLIDGEILRVLAINEVYGYLKGAE